MARNIESPGVQISEIDLSLNASLPVGTNVLINGFTDQGPAQELLNITSLGEYEQIFGVPTNAAERYSYHTMKNVLSTPAKVVFNRLPYGVDGGDGYNDTEYTALAYPIFNGANSGSTYISGDGHSSTDKLFIGKPSQVALSEADYIALQKGIQWDAKTVAWSHTGFTTVNSLSSAGFIVINKMQTSTNQDFEGYYLGLSDNKRASATATVPDFEFNSIKHIQTNKAGTWSNISTDRLDFKLTGDIGENPNSISESIESAPSWDFGNENYNDGVIFGLYKLSRSAYSKEQNALTFTQAESYIGSLGENRKYTDPTGFQETSFFVENLMNEDSAFMEVLVNDNLANGNWLDDNGIPNRDVNIYSVDSELVLRGQSHSTAFTLSNIPEVSGTFTHDTFNSMGSPIYEHTLSTATIMFDYTQNRWVSLLDTIEKAHCLADNQVDMFVSETDWSEIVPSGPAISGENIVYHTTIPVPTSYGDDAHAIGRYTTAEDLVKEIGEVSSKLQLGLRLAEDYEVVPLDLVLDAGLSTIHTTMKTLKSESATPDDVKEFDDGKAVNITDLLDPANGKSSDIAAAWLSIFNQFDIFCKDVRKDCMFIADVYRNILIKGRDAKLLDNKTRNFSQDAYTPLKNLTAGCNSSYSATYAQWVKVYDAQSSEYSWIPYSGFQAAIMARLDSKLFPWSAPAGLENGLVAGGLDLALPSTQKQRDLLYRNNLNAVVFFPSDGMVCWGQKTLQKKPSAFDRINVRRLFLTLEKSTRSLMKYFVFQPNSAFTRSRVINILTPIFDIAKNNEGVYDYLIVCDERNNTPQVIDANELKVDIYLKPVRTAEFILVNFYATRTDQNFSELI